MTRWEYLTVLWQWHFAFDVGKAEPSFWSKTLIYRPGVEKEEREGPLDWNALANELGDEGWELVSDYTAGSNLGQAQGWPNASRPIKRRSIFKRPKP